MATPFDIFSWPTASAFWLDGKYLDLHSGAAGILSTFPPLTFAIEILVEHFKTVAFLLRQHEEMD